MKKPNGAYVSCKDCIFWDVNCISEVKNMIDYTESVCRRYPPIHTLSSGDETDDFRQPWTAENAWCGEFKITTVTP